MRSEQLEYFIEIVKCKSMNLASEEFHVSQQTLSNSVKNLEQELGVQLLQRSYVGVTLTKEGESFLEIAKNFLKSIEDFQEKYGVKESTLNGQLNIYATSAACSSIFPKLIPLFLKEHNKVEINMIETNFLTINEIFQSDPISTKLMMINVFDCGGEEISLYRVEKELTYEEFLSEDYVVVAGRDSVLSSYKSVSLKTLLNYPLIFCGSKSKELNLSYLLLRQYGEPITCLVSDNPYVYLQAIVDNNGVGFMSMTLLQNELLTGFVDRVKIIPIKEKVSSINYWAMLKEQAEDSLLKEFINISKKNVHIFK